jgi:diaminopimelate epimerase
MTEYFKLSGGGNDFLALTEPEDNPIPESIVRWCARGASAGADGLFVLRRKDAGVVRMIYFNADGNRAALCLNGTRCAARLTFHLGWATTATVIETDAGCYTATDQAEHVVGLVMPRPPKPQAPDQIQLESDSWETTFIDVGVPHLVLHWEGPMREAPVSSVGPAMRNHPKFSPDGTNVDFVSFPSLHSLEIRSFERGVEAETLACGTGVLAAVAVGLEAGLAQLPIVAMTLGGFEISISAVAERPEHWAMSGDARLIAVGKLADGAGVGPAPPGWT